MLQMRRSLLLPVWLATMTGCALQTHVASHSTRILTLTAVDFEYGGIRPLLEDPVSELINGRQITRGHVGAADVVLVRTGWGKANAAASASFAIDRFQPSLVVMAGVAGGLGPMNSGDVVVSGELFQHDVGKKMPTRCDASTPNGAPCPFEIWPPETPTQEPFPKNAFVTNPLLSATAARAARAAAFTPWALPHPCECEQDGERKPNRCVGEEETVGRHSPMVCVGTMATGDQFIADPETAERLARERNTVSVDMETAAVAQEAATRQIPFVALRLISDVVSGTGESLYYCLKPMASARLRAVMGQVLPALAANLDRVASDDPAGAQEELSCSTGSAIATPTRRARRVRESHGVRLR